MRFQTLLFALLSLTSLSVVGQSTELGLAPSKSSTPSLESVLESQINHFEIHDATLVEGLSTLSKLSILNLHLGIEQVLGQNDRPAPVVRFTLTLNNANVKQVLNALCEDDARYRWVVDGYTVNIYPRNNDSELDFLTSLRLDHIEFENVRSPYFALTPLARVLPRQQIGYAAVGATAEYSQPWTAHFENLTVRQYLNRLAERVEPNGLWILSGTKQNRFLAFFPRSFN